MSNFSAQIVGRVAGIATLALAALPVAALTTTAAHAAPTPAHVRIGDLDLGTRAGLTAFDQRVEKAGQAMCGGQRELAVRNACRDAVRTEAREKLSQIAG